MAPTPLVQAQKPILVQSDTVSLLAGLIGIERDLILGNLFLQDGLVSETGSHFEHPRRDDFPVIKDGLAAAGAPDLEPLLIALETAREKEEVEAAIISVRTGLKKAKEVLAPTEADLLAAVIQAADAARVELDPSGTTAVYDYQDAWGLLMAARGALDPLIFSRDPAVKIAATDMALAFDEVVLFAPDPNAKAPVVFDPALIADLIATLSGASGSI
jgi:hypothetical protein